MMEWWFWLVIMVANGFACVATWMAYRSLNRWQKFQNERAENLRIWSEANRQLGEALYRQRNILAEWQDALAAKEKQLSEWRAIR